MVGGPIPGSSGMNGHWDGSIPGAVAPWQGPIMAAPALWPVPGASWPLSGMNAMWNGAHGPVDPRWKTTSCSHFEQSGFCPRCGNSAALPPLLRQHELLPRMHVKALGYKACMIHDRVQMSEYGLQTGEQLLSVGTGVISPSC